MKAGKVISTKICNVCTFTLLNFTYIKQELAAHLNRPHILSIKPQPLTDLRPTLPSLPTKFPPLAPLPAALSNPPDNASSTLVATEGSVVRTGCEYIEQGEGNAEESVEECQDSKCRYT